MPRHRTVFARALVALPIAFAATVWLFAAPPNEAARNARNVPSHVSHICLPPHATGSMRAESVYRSLQLSLPIVVGDVCKVVEVVPPYEGRATR